jgi:hypothetical protein
MNCERYKETGDKAHLKDCAECRTWEALRAYPEIAPSRDFFRGIRAKLAPRILRFAAPFAAAAAVLLLAVVLTLQPPASLTSSVPAAAQATDEERELVENLEILQNYELLRSLEFIGENGEERK